MVLNSLQTIPVRRRKHVVVCYHLFLVASPSLLAHVSGKNLGFLHASHSILHLLRLAACLAPSTVSATPLRCSVLRKRCTEGRHGKEGRQVTLQSLQQDRTYAKRQGASASTIRQVIVTSRSSNCIGQGVLSTPSRAHLLGVKNCCRMREKWTHEVNESGIYIPVQLR